MHVHVLYTLGYIHTSRLFEEETKLLLAGGGADNTFGQFRPKIVSDTPIKHTRMYAHTHTHTHTHTSTHTHTRTHTHTYKHIHVYIYTHAHTHTHTHTHTHNHMDVAIIYWL